MHHTLVKSLIVGTLAIASTLASDRSVAQGTPVTFQLNWMAGGANAGFDNIAGCCRGRG